MPTPRTAAPKAIEGRSERWRAALEHDPQLGLFERNLDTGHGWWDATLRSIWGLSADEPLPEQDELIGAILQPDQQAFRERFTAIAQPGQVGEAEFRFMNRRGELRTLRCFWRVSRLADGTRVTTGTAHDITAAVEALAQGLQREARLQQARMLALDVAGIGSWEWDPAQDLFRFDATLLALHGWSGRSPEITPAQWLAAIHPADRERLQRSWANAVACRDLHGSARFRVQQPDGDWRHLRLSVAPMPLHGPPGTPAQGLQGVCFDETDALRLERELRAEREVLATAERLALVGSWRRPLDGSRAYWSPQVHAIFGWNPAHPLPLGESMGRFFPDGGWERLLEADARQQLDRQPFMLELDLLRADGSRGRVRTWNELECDDEGVPVARRGCVQDISGLAAVRRRADLSEAQLRAVFEHAGQAIMMVDDDRRIVAINPACVQLLGMDAAMLTGHRLDVVAPDMPLALIEQMWGALQRDGRLSGDVSLRNARGEPVQASLLAAARVLPGLHMGLLSDVTEQRRSEQALRSAQSQLRELAARLQEDHDRLRVELARDLHDQLGQTLSALKLELDMLGRQGAEGVPRLRALLDEAVSTVRDISRELRPPMLELGLLPALRAHAADLSMRSDFDVALRLPATLPALPQAAAGGLYRIAQEALNNVSRHAGAREVLLQVRIDAHQLELLVQDDGRGFDPSGAEGGLGLLGMRERATQIGAALQLESAPGRGTRVRVAWPLPAPASVPPEAPLPPLPPGHPPQPALAPDLP